MSIHLHKWWKKMKSVTWTITSRNTVGAFLSGFWDVLFLMFSFEFIFIEVVGWKTSVMFGWNNKTSPKLIMRQHKLCYKQRFPS